MGAFREFDRQRLPQKEVDRIRFDVQASLVVQGVKDRNPHVPLYHLRFLKGNTVRSYIARKGNPPPDSERKPWERGVRLEVDVGFIEPELALFVMRQISQRRRDSEAAGDMNTASIRKRIADGVSEEASKIYMPHVDEPVIIAPPSRTVPKSILNASVTSYGSGKS